MRSTSSRIGQEASGYLEMAVLLAAAGYSTFQLVKVLERATGKTQSKQNNSGPAESSANTTVGEAAYYSPAVRNLISDAVRGVKLSDFLSDLPPFRSLREAYEEKAHKMNLTDEWLVFLGIK